MTASDRTQAAAIQCQDDPSPESWEELRAAIWQLIGEVVKRFHVYMSATCDNDDMMQEGWFAVVNSVNKWDRTRMRFTTYVGRSIRNHLSDTINLTAYTLRLPMNPATSDKNHRTAEQVAVQTANEDRVKRSGYAVQFVWDSLTREEKYTENVQVYAWLAVLASEYPTDAEIVRRRFGLNTEPETLDMIGDSMGRTRECIRLRERRGLTLLSRIARVGRA